VVSQRIFKEDRIERRMVLREVGGTIHVLSAVRAYDSGDLIDDIGARRRECNARRRRASVWVFEHVEEIRADGAVAPRVSVVRDADRRGLGTEQRHQRVVEWSHGNGVTDAKVDVAEERKRVTLVVADSLCA
jgi:hypothetical protein